MADSPLLVELRKLTVNEVSAVDAPANLLDGWMVMKARAADTFIRGVAQHGWAGLTKAAGCYGEPYRPGEARAILAASGDVEAADDLRKVLNDDDLFVNVIRAHSALDAIPENADDPLLKAIRKSASAPPPPTLEEAGRMFGATVPVTRSAIEQGIGVPGDQHPQNSPHHSQAQPREGGRFKSKLFKPAVPKPKLGGTFF